MNMREACYCGRTGEIADREPVFGGNGRPALRCPDEACSHLEYLEWLPEAGRNAIFAEAVRRSDQRKSAPAA